jgi:hypothetical protein
VVDKNGQISPNQKTQSLLITFTCEVVELVA